MIEKVVLCLPKIKWLKYTETSMTDKIFLCIRVSIGLGNFLGFSVIMLGLS